MGNKCGVIFLSDQLIRNFDIIIDYCFQLFKSKNLDYGPTWLLYRYSSINDEIWRKAKRIRTLEEHLDIACIPEGRDVEYIGIINYCIMFLIKMDKGFEFPILIDDLNIIDTIDDNLVYSAYQREIGIIRELLIKKNTDYGDAWKSMSLSSMTDQVIIRVYRIRRILNNGGSVSVSEGIPAQLYDIINYCVFALIKTNTELIQLL